MVTEEDRALIAAAEATKNHAHAPFSRYPVGAAVRTSSGHTFTGCNVENASFSLTCCAERVAVFKAVSEGKREIVACAIVTDEAGPIPPCGACRQVLHEFGPEMRIVLGDGAGNVRIMTLSELLPEGFSAAQVLDRKN